MFNKMQIVNHNLRENVTTNEKYIPRKMSLKFCKIAFYIYFAKKFEPFWSQETISVQRNYSGTSNSDWIRLYASIS